MNKSVIIALVIATMAIAVIASTLATDNAYAHWRHGGGSGGNYNGNGNVQSNSATATQTGNGNGNGNNNNGGGSGRCGG